MQYQFFSRSGMSALTQRANSVLYNQGLELQASGAVDNVQLHKDDDDDEPFLQGIRHCLEMLKNHNTQSWIEDNPSQNAPQDKPAQILFIPLGAASVPNSQAASAATNNTSPSSRVAQHRIWGSTLVTASNGTQQVKFGVLSQDFKEILHTTRSKSNQAQIFAESLSGFLEE
eukprot:10826728-Ditylum_brightwellii.AAC.1